MVKNLKRETEDFSKILKKCLRRISKVAALDRTNLLKDELRK